MSRISGILSKFYESVNDFIVESEFPNGIKFATQKRIVGKNIDFCVNIGTGSYDDPLEKQGVGHFLEHLLIGNQLDSKIQRKGGYIGLTTYADYIKLSGTIPNSQENKQLIIQTIKTFLKGLDLSEELFVKEKNRILNEIGIHTDSAQEYKYSVLGKAFQNNRSDGNILGTREDVNTITLEDLKEYLRLNITGDNVYIGMTGKFSHDEMKTQLSDALEDIPQADNRVLYSPEVQPGYYSVEASHLSQTYFNFCFPVEQSQNQREQYVSRVAGNYLNAIAERDVIFGTGLVYSLSLRLLTSIRRDSYLDITGNIMKEQTKTIIPATTKLITDVTSEIEDDVFQGVIAGINSQFRSGQILPPAYSATEISYEMMLFGEVTRDAIDEITFQSISAQDIRQHLKNIFSKDPAIVVYGDDSNFGNYDDFITSIRRSLENAPS